jgi:hypothetical protein
MSANRRFTIMIKLCTFMLNQAWLYMNLRAFCFTHITPCLSKLLSLNA